MAVLASPAFGSVAGHIPNETGPPILDLQAHSSENGCSTGVKALDQISPKWDKEMTRIRVPGERPLYWVASSLKDLTRFPEAVQRAMGFALGAAQFGGKHPSARPWKGEGPGVLEVVKDFDRNTYRAVYTVRFARAVYVLHAFQKKSPQGIATRESDVALIRERLRTAQRDYEARHGSSQGS